MGMTGQEIMIQVGTNLNTKQAQNQLSEFVKKAEKSTIVEVKVKDSITGITKLQKRLETLTTYVDSQGNSFVGLSKDVIRTDGSLINISNTITKANTKFDSFNKTLQQTSKKTETYTNASGSLITRIEEFNQHGEKLVTYIKQTTDAQGGLTTTTRTLNETTNELISTNKTYELDLVKQEKEKKKLAEETKKLIEAERERMADTRTVTTQTKDYINNQRALITTTKELNSKGETVITTTTEYTNKMGYAVKVIEKTDSQGNKLAGTMTTMSKSATKLGQSFSDIITKVAKFYLASLPIRAVQIVITEAIASVKEFDSVLTEFKKVSDLSGSSLDEYVDKLTDLGNTVGRTTSEMIQGATEFKKAGFSNEDSAILAQVASYYQNTADEVLSASEATSVLVSMMKAFKIEAKDAIHITDAINQVSQDFAVSSGDIGKGLTQAGASLSTYGNTFEQTIGLVTAGTEIFQGKSQQVARGLNTVASRIAKNRDALLVYNIDILDSNENLRSTYDILSDLAPKWEQMSNAEKVALGTTLAGVNQYKVFSAVMNNFDKAIESTTEAMNSEGATLRQNAVYMESLQAKLAKLKQEFQKLVNEGGVLNKFFKIIIDIGIAILKVANSDIGRFIIKIVALGTALKLLPIQSIIVTFGKLKSSIGVLLTGIGTFALELKNGLVPALNYVGLAIKSNPLFVGLTIATTLFALGSLVKELFNIESASEKAKKQYESLKSSLQESEDNIANNNSQIKELNKSLKTLQERIASIQNLEKNQANDSRLRQLKLEEQELQNNIKLLEQQNQLENRKAERLAKRLYESKTQRISIEPTIEDGVLVTKKSVTPIEKLQDEISSYTELNRLIDEALSKGDQVPQEVLTVKDIIVSSGNEMATALLSIYNSIDGLDDKTGEVSEEELALKEQILSQVDAWQNLIGVQKETNENYELTEEQVNELINRYGLTEEAIQDYINSVRESEGFEISRAQAVEELCSQMNEAEVISLRLKEQLKQLDGVQLKDINDAFKSVSNAVKELNSANGLTLDTYEQLMSLDVDYLSVLFDEEGNLRSTADAQRELYYAKIDNMGVSQALALVENAVAIEANNGSGAYANYANSIATVTTSAWDSVYALIQMKVQLNELSGAGAVVLNKQVKAMQNMATQAKRNYRAYTGATSATKGHTGATKENTNALKENVEMLKKQKEALDDEVDKYEKVIAYINSKLDDEIDRLEDLKDTEVDNIDVRINKLQDLADAKDDYYNKEIEKIKELKDQDKEYWNERIQELKDANNELEEQLELQKLLDALESAKRKKVKVYQDGKGFVYQTDQNVVSQAQKNLDEYYRKKSYQDQLKELENQRNAQEKIYDKQIEDLEKKQKEEKELYDKEIKDLENQKKKVEDKYNGLIKIFQDYKDKFKDQTDAYETEQNRLLALQLTGIDFEKDNWQQLLVMQTEGAKAENDIYSSRLGALQSFADAYMEKQKQLQKATEAYNKALEKYNQAQQTSSSSGGGGGGFGIGATEQPTTTPTYYYVYQQLGSFRDQSSAQTSAKNYKNANRDAIVSIKKDGNSWYALKRVGNAYTSLDKAKGQANALTTQSRGKTIYRAYNKGVSSIDSDQMAIVGENPNKEIVIGSKLNNGVMTKLPKGSGVVNARSTNTLAGIINQLGFAKSNFGIGSGNPINNDSSQNFIIENVTIDGANITDMNSFRNSLMNLKSEATQRAYRRK